MASNSHNRIDESGLSYLSVRHAIVIDETFRLETLRFFLSFDYNTYMQKAYHRDKSDNLVSV